MAAAPNPTLLHSAGELWRRPARVHFRISARLFLWFLAIVIDFFFAPALYNGSAIWMSATAMLLIYRAGQASGAEGVAIEIPLAAVRLALFFALNAAIVLAARHFAAPLEAAGASDALDAAARASLKFSVLIPAIVLFPPRTWREILRTFHAELTAALIVLLTFFPYRLFHMIFPVYSQVIGTLAYWIARPFVAGTHYLGGPEPIILAPQLDLQIVFACSGLSALVLFDLIIALIAFLDWNELNRARLFAAYVYGSLAILAANIVRIGLLVIIGNRIAPAYATGEFHVNAGWLFFAAIYTCIVIGSYRWMLQRTATRS
jgi:exosortase/archaeosortase family protein